MTRVLYSKMIAPAAIDGMLQRAALVTRALAADNARVVLIQAPAGYGKTTLLQQIRTRLGEQEIRSGWLTLDEGDDDLSRFLAHLHAVIDLALEASPDSALPSPPLDATIAGYGMVEELLNRVTLAGRRLAILIDEFQVIRSDAILSLMRRFIAQLPASLTLYIASRTVPSLGLSRLLLHHQALILRSEDLSFTRVETAAFFADTAADSSDGHLLEELHLRTEGWPAALQLARLAAVGRHTSQAIEDLWFANAGIFEDYLADNVLSAQQPAIQSFLLGISVLRVVSPALAAELTGMQNAAQVLADLCRAGFFLRPLPGDDQWFKIHSLFAAYLARQLARRGAHEVLELNRRAMQWYLAREHFEEAMYHAVCSRSFAIAAETLERWSDQLVREARLATIERWLDELPTAEVLARPGLQIRVLWALMFLRRAAKIGPLYDALAAALARGALVNITHVTMPILRAIRSMVEDDIAGAGEVAMSIDVAREPADAFEAFEVAAAANVQAFYLRAVGQFAAAHAKLPVALAASQRADAVFSAAYALANSATVLLAEARLREALAQGAKGYAMTAATRGSHAAAVVAACYAEALYYDDARRAARALLEDAMPIIRDVCLTDALAVAHVTLSKILLLDGDAESAATVLREGDALATAARLPRLMRILRWEQVRQLLAGGQVGAARALADTLHRDLPAAPSALVFHAEEIDDAVIGALRLAVHERRAAQVLLQVKPLARLAQQGGRVLRGLRLRMLEALALDQLGDSAAALRVSRDLVQRIAPQGLQRFVLEEPGMAALLERVRDQGRQKGQATAADYLDSLLATQSKTVAATSVDGEQLSEREVDILAMLKQGLSNRDVGARLFVSENTVKYHLKNIYAKLGARNRTEACNIALTRGLLRD